MKINKEKIYIDFNYIDGVLVISYLFENGMMGGIKYKIVGEKNNYFKLEKESLKKINNYLKKKKNKTKKEKLILKKIEKKKHITYGKINKYRNR